MLTKDPSSKAGRHVGESPGDFGERYAAAVVPNRARGMRCRSERRPFAYAEQAVRILSNLYNEDPSCD